MSFINIYKHNLDCVLHSVFRLHITSNVPANTITPKCPASEYCFHYIEKAMIHTILSLESTAAYTSFAMCAYTLNLATI